MAQALRAQRNATLALLRCLEPPAWEQPCLPPWRVRDVVAHLVTLDEAAVSGRLLRVLRTHTPAELERWNSVAVERLAAAQPEELLELLERTGARLQRRVTRLPRTVARLPLRTRFGRQPLYVIVCRRVVDEYVHSADIARTAGTEPVSDAAVAEAVATGVLETLPALALPALEDRAGVVRLVVGTSVPGGSQGPRRTWSIDLARRQYGPRVTARPAATVRLHAGVLALLTERRLTWQDADVVVEGEAALAGRVLDRLAT
jgi:uncharacterized protein (TIGR03083 family)